ncbi:hypothetical protein [Paraprevotella clara]|uniref:hypothetical protein n=1 Tax=Paraprevotella clara TaxID=454154 RepID=UPI0032C12B4C
MRWFKYCKFLMVCCLVAVFSGCEEDDDYRGYMLSGRWFGNLGMMVDGQPAIGSDLEFIPQDYGGYTQGYGYEIRLAGSGGNCRALLYLDGKRRHYLPAFR